MLETVAWREGQVAMLDQRVLPDKVRYLNLKTPERVIWAIQEMVIRGAPAIGVAAAMGIALGAARIKAGTRPAWERRFTTICRKMAAARPTAVNLVWAVRRMERLVEDHPQAGPRELNRLLRTESELMLEEDIAANKAMGRLGAEFLPG